MKPVEINYFSDVLCIWAYVSQTRIDAVQKKHGNTVRIHHRFCSVFGDTERKIATAWKDRGGYSGFNAHLKDVAKRFPSVEVHPELWLKTRPPTSSSAHLFMKAVGQSLNDAMGSTGHSSAGVFAHVLHAIRVAFFRDCRDIARWDVQCEIAEPLGVDLAAIERHVHSGAAFALLAADYQDAEKMRIEGSPSFVLNEGRQKLYGNVGFHLIEANIQELLRSPGANEASWC